jgi:hypothetical protein
MVIDSMLAPRTLTQFMFRVALFQAVLVMINPAGITLIPAVSRGA